jgi:3-oxoacyl-[acyl-carrier protein] reductase
LEELSWRLLEKLLSLRELPAGSMEFARQGARQVLVLARSRDALEHLAQEIATIGSQAIPMPCDITQTEQVHIAIAQGWRDHGPIDILVNCAGIAHQQMFLQFHPRQLQEEISINLLGLVTITRAVARRMAKQRQGLIVNLTLPPTKVGGFLRSPQTDS